MKTFFNNILFALFILPSFIMAQNKITGTVTEQSTSLPLPGVNVIVKGTSQGTATDFDGHFKISVNTGDVLEFSYVGYIPQEIIYDGQAIVNVVLAEDTSQLEEVVIIGYGSVKKEDLTGAVDLLTEEDFNKGPIVSAQQLISGKIAGVSVTSNGGAPGEGQEIRIRGISSLSLNSNPLYVIDGSPIDNGSVGGSRNPLNLINPNDIESMVVLKDASATAIYGSRAANGVILITTKKGKNSAFKFNINSSTSVYNPVNKVDVLSADEFRTVVNSTGDANAIARLGTANTDWQDEIYTSAYGSDHTISALGSAFGVPMRASLGYSNHDGILIGDNLERTTASLNFTPSLLEDHLKIELNARGMYTENTFANRGAIGSAIGFDPTQSVYDANSIFDGYYAWTDNSGQQLSLAPTNPIALQNLVDNTSEVRRLVGNAKFDYKLHFFEDLTATVNIGLDKSNGSGRTLVSDLIPTTDATWNGSRSTYTQEHTNKLFDAYLTYNKSFKDVHNLTAVVGHSYQSFEYDNYSYDSEKEEDGNDFEFIDLSKSVLMSYFGRLNYNYDGKYLVTASLRADASSKLNKNDRWGYFPSVALAWNMHKENFLKSNNFLDELKLRVGYGEVGNVNGLGDYQFLTNYTGSQSTANYQFGSEFYQTYRPSPINENLRWEISKTINIGLDYALLNHRVYGSVNAYIKETEDLINNSIIDPFTNFGNRINRNIGDMENRGIELSISVVPVKTDDLEWTISYNVAFNDNEITNLPDDQETGGISGGVGNNIQIHTEGYSPSSFLVYKQVYDTSGNPIEGSYVDRNGDNIINDDDRYIYKDPYADIIMGLNSNLNYKSWDLSIATRANIGNYAYNNVASSTGYLTRATENNILSNLHTDYLSTGFNSLTENNLLSDHYIQDASFFKIDNITLGYRLENAIKDTTMRFYGSLQNVLTVTDYDGLDPEILGGIDNNFYPRPRTFVLGVNVDF